MTKKLSLLALLCLMTTLASAKIELPTILGSDMVMQQNTNASLWGKAKANAVVTVTTSWNNMKTTSKAAANGQWSLKVATPAYGGPYSITISDGETLKLDNILIGEVWVCSGQSNMEMPVLGFTNQPVDGSDRAIIDGGSYKNIRLFNVERNTSDKPLDDCLGVWKQSSAQTVAAFSATAYFFGLNLTKALGNMPVGLINSSWGGTMIQPWMPAQCSERVMDEQYLTANNTENPRKKMGHLYNAMIYPIRNFAARGFLWYQGEANLSQNKVGKNGTKVYANLMQEMVAQWRSDWGDKSNAMPFYYVQIAPYNYENPNDITRALLVENQVDALKLIPNCGMAATTDIGNPTCIHPAQKGVVGERLALLALAQTYGVAKDVPVDAPSVKTFEFKDGVAYVEFNMPQSGFEPQGMSNLTGFEVCGEDKVFYPATKAALNNKAVVTVACDKVAQPIAVRYAFRNYIEVNMFNMLGIPPFSFRSDDF